VTRGTKFPLEEACRRYSLSVDEFGSCRSRSTDTVLVRYAQRVSNGIVLDSGVEGGGKKVRTTAWAMQGNCFN
jgi:hypothetical protein